MSQEGTLAMSAMMNWLLIALAPWAIICDDYGSYSFTDQFGEPTISISETREEAIRLRDSIKAWVEADWPEDWPGEIKWHECLEEKPW